MISSGSQTSFVKGGRDGVRVRARNNYDINLALSISDCIIDDRTALYIAMPITSGRRLWNLAKRIGIQNLEQISSLHPRLFEQEVFEPNLNDATQMVRGIRSRYSQPVIDPSRLVVREWTQEQYRSVWRAVISSKVSLLIVSNMWEYSIGCVEEVSSALENRIPILDQSDRLLTLNDISSAIAGALADALDADISADYLIRAQNFLDAGTTEREARVL